MDVIPLRGPSLWSFDHDLKVRFPGGHGEDVIRSVLIDDQVRALFLWITSPADENKSQKVFTAGEDGIIRAWRMPHDQEEPIKGDGQSNHKKQHKATRGQGESSRPRFRPY